MNKQARIEMVRAMETLARSINDENYLERWLMCGVADGDIRKDTTDEELEWYAEDDNFKDLMDLFIKLMYKAANNGGLYCDGIVSNSREVEWK